MRELPETLSHAYLITGGSGEGRSAYARRLTQAYLCQGERPPCGQCLPCRKVAAGIHPDVSLIAPAEGKREISVDQVRSLRADAYVRPNEGRRKIYLIDPADSMNPAAPNSLLKVLAEGRPIRPFCCLPDTRAHCWTPFAPGANTLPSRPRRHRRHPSSWRKGPIWPGGCWRATSWRWRRAWLPWSRRS